MNLKINQTEKEDNIIYLTLSGEVDVYTASNLKETLIPLTEIKGKELIVDLSNVQYIDSTGLGIFIGALKSTHNFGSSIKLVGLTDRVRRLFKITGLDEVIDIAEDSREEAK